MHTRFILMHTSHSGNVGAVARAMKVMGFDDLVLVQPRWADVLQRPETLERASGAVDVLEKARIVQTWEEAVQGVEYLCATAMTPRNFGPPTTEPRACFAQLAAAQAASDAAQNAIQDAVPPRSVGLVFGSERYGMRNEEVYRCHVCLRIPVNPAYGSLNLAAAAQVLAYEWRQALGGFGLEKMPVDSTTLPAARLADAAQVQATLAHWEQALAAIGYLDAQTRQRPNLTISTDTQVMAEYLRTSGTVASVLQGGLDQAVASYGSIDAYLRTGLGLTDADFAALKAKFA